MSSPPADTQTTAYAARHSLPQHLPPCVLHFRPIPSLCTQYLAVGPKSPSHGRSCHPACRYPNYRIRSMPLTPSTPPTMCFALQTNTEPMRSVSGRWAQIPLPRPIMSFPPADTQTTAYAICNALPQHLPLVASHPRPILSARAQYLVFGPKSFSCVQSCHPACRYPNYHIHSIMRNFSTPTPRHFPAQINAEHVLLSIWFSVSNAPLHLQS